VPPCRRWQRMENEPLKGMRTRREEKGPKESRGRLRDSISSPPRVGGRLIGQIPTKNAGHPKGLFVREREVDRGKVREQNPSWVTRVLREREKTHDSERQGSWTTSPIERCEVREVQERLALRRGGTGPRCRIRLSRLQKEEQMHEGQRIAQGKNSPPS